MDAKFLYVNSTSLPHDAYLPNLGPVVNTNLIFIFIYTCIYMYILRTITKDLGAQQFVDRIIFKIK